PMGEVAVGRGNQRRSLRSLSGRPRHHAAEALINIQTGKSNGGRPRCLNIFFPNNQDSSSLRPKNSMPMLRFSPPQAAKIPCNERSRAATGEGANLNSFEIFRNQVSAETLEIFQSLPSGRLLLVHDASAERAD